jgi:UDP-N-acetylglucosamine/UDP-N-acetylgalactosamine 4-epimerase
MKKALVTGAAGFIGSNLVKRLLAEGWNVVGVDDLSSGNLKLLEGVTGLRLVINDFACKSIIDDIQSQEFDVVFHLAAIPRVSFSVENPSLTTDVNVGRTVCLMDACRGNISRFVYSSSSSVYGGADTLPTPVTHLRDPKSPYAWQKSCVEDLLRTFGSLYDFDSVCLRYFNVFGPNQYGDSPYSTAISAWCHAVKNGTSLRKDGTGDQSRDMCYVDNVVDVNIRAANHEGTFRGEPFNVACGDRTSNNQILEAFQERFGDLDIDQSPFRPGDVMHTQADISETERVFGYTPLVRFWEGLEKTFEWWNI